MIPSLESKILVNEQLFKSIALTNLQSNYSRTSWNTLILIIDNNMKYFIKSSLFIFISILSQINHKFILDVLF